MALQAATEGEKGEDIGLQNSDTASKRKSVRLDQCLKHLLGSLDWIKGILRFPVIAEAKESCEINGVAFNGVFQPTLPGVREHATIGHLTLKQVGKIWG